MFLESMILAVFLSGSTTHPADFGSPFLASCQPVQKADLQVTYFETYGIENPLAQRMVLLATDPLFELSATYTCGCFERAYSGMQGPVPFQDLWATVALLAEGQTDAARALMQPLDSAPAEVRARYQQQIAARSPVFSRCVSASMDSMGDIPVLSPIAVILGVKLGYIPL